MRKRSALLVSAFSASLSFAAFAQPAPDAKKPAPAAPDAKKPAPAAPEAKKPAPAAAEAKKPAPAAPAEPKPATAPAAAPAPAAPAPAVEPAPSEAPAPAPAADSTEGPDASPEPAGALPAQPGLQPLPVWPEPSDDAAALKRQGAERPGTAKRGPSDAVFAEDWWTHTRPILEWHGALRARGELFYKFHLGRHDDPNAALFPRPADHYYTPGTSNTPVGSNLCTPKDNGSGSADGYGDAKSYCTDNTISGANMRFRLDPEFHISDNLRVISQIDLLDNLVLGSTPSGAASENGSTVPRNGYAPLGALDDGTSAPNSRNSLRDSIIVKRVWAEWTTPVGQLRFGRMPNHWGLGMVYNSGDGHDDDYQSTIDRAQIISGVKSLDLYASAAIDFPNEGPTSDSLSVERGQPYDVAQLDDVNQYTFSVLRKKAPELTRAALSKGDVVVNGGFQLVYRHQLLASDTQGTCASGGAVPNCSLPLSGTMTALSDNTFIRRGAHIWQPDLWLQVLYGGFRFEAEAATVQGSIENVSVGGNPAAKDENWKIRSWGFAGEIEQALAENKLHLGFKSGWASGDADVNSLTPGTGVQDQHGNHTISTFRFHPSYALDLILYRNILTRVQGTYFFRPSVKYDFLRDQNGQKVGGGIAAVWSRASEFMQTPGHARDLGVELNGELYFQSKDGSLNDDPGRMGGFFAKLQYAVLFPMAGLGYTSNEAAALNSANNKSDYADTNLAQALRLFLGVSF